MKNIRTILTMLVCLGLTLSAEAKNFVLKNDKVQLSVSKKGELVELRNLTTGHNYASGGYLWRMYYDTHDEQEIEIIGGEQSPKGKGDGKVISLENTAHGSTRTPFLQTNAGFPTLFCLQLRCV